jgi:hypothetical protein
MFYNISGWVIYGLLWDLNAVTCALSQVEEAKDVKVEKDQAEKTKKEKTKKEEKDKTKKDKKEKDKKDEMDKTDKKEKVRRFPYQKCSRSLSIFIHSPPRERRREKEY